MAKAQIYLNFPGNTEEAFNFYKSAFGTEFAMIQRFNETPEAGDVSPEDGNKIMHVSLPIGDGSVLMATDALESMGQKLTMWNNFSISLDTKSKEEADRLFNKLSEWGKVEMPMDVAFWWSYYGMLTDRFGIQWMVSFNMNR